MKISLNWLTDYVDVPVSAKKLGEILTHIGINCDGIDETAGDVIFTFDVTSNRPDWLGHIGMAREASTALGTAFHPPVIGQLATAGDVKDLTSVQVLDSVLCPRYTARVIRNVKVGPSPAWLVEKLQSVGLRSVNNIVDVTNFVLFEYSQPLHSFDFDKLAGRRIVVRRASDGEMLVSIDSTKCPLDSSMLVIADAEKPVAIAGVMGGLNTEVTEATTSVLIESAQFEPLSIRRTSRKLGLMSESNYRFERGIDPVGLEQASLRACQLILDLAGGELASGMIDVWAQPHVAPVVELRPQRTAKLLGIDVPISRQVEILTRLGLSPELKDGLIRCTIPSFRRDQGREIDLIEEIARIEGYDRIPVGSQVTHRVTPPGKTQRTRLQVAEVLSAAGYDEAMTFTFIDQAEADLLGEPDALHVDPLVRKSNNVLRPSLLASLLRACKNNQDAGNAEVSLYELSAVFPPAKAGLLPQEHIELAMVSSRDLRQLRGAIEAVIGQVNPQTRLEFVEAAVAGLAEGSSASIVLDGKVIGSLGVVSAKLKDYYGLEREYAAGSMAFAPLLAVAGKVRTYQPIAKFPPVRRDLSLVVDEDVTWRQLTQMIQQVNQQMLAGVEYVTTYRGKQIPQGRKSVTATLTYQSAEGTLRSSQVDEQVAQIVEAARKQFNAELRA